MGAQYRSTEVGVEGSAAVSTPGPRRDVIGSVNQLSMLMNRGILVCTSPRDKHPPEMRRESERDGPACTTGLVIPATLGLICSVPPGLERRSPRALPRSGDRGPLPARKHRSGAIFVVQGLRLLGRHRQILLATARNEVKARYAGTLFGLAWTVIYPLLFLGLYSVMYTVVFRVRVESLSTFEYVLMIFCGLIPFIGFSEALSSGVSSVVANKALLNNTMFPAELIPVKSTLVATPTMLVSIGMLQLTLWARGDFFLTQLLVPVVLILQLLFSIGLVWLLAAINVFFRDVAQLIGIIILFLMLVSPIAYTLEMVPTQLLPVMYLNPLFYLIFLYRDTMVRGVFPGQFLAVFSLITAVTFVAGHHVFTRLRGVFDEYV